MRVKTYKSDIFNALPVATLQLTSAWDWFTVYTHTMGSCLFKVVYLVPSHLTWVILERGDKTDLSLMLFLIGARRFCLNFSAIF